MTTPTYPSPADLAELRRALRTGPYTVHGRRYALAPPTTYGTVWIDPASGRPVYGIGTPDHMFPGALGLTAGAAWAYLLRRGRP
jgi:hypothetical protein